MRYVNFGLTIVLFVLVGVLFSRISQMEKTPSPKPSKSSSEKIQEMMDGQGAAISLAFVDLDTLVDNYERHRELREKLEAKFKRAEREFQNQVKGFEQDYKLLEQEAPKMNEEQLQRAQMDLARLEQQIMQMRESRSKELMDEESKLNRELKQEVDAVVEALQEEMGIDFILLKEPSGVLVGARADFDVTWLVLERLNEAYKAKKSPSGKP